LFADDFGDRPTEIFPSSTDTVAFCAVAPLQVASPPVLEKVNESVQLVVPAAETILIEPIIIHNVIKKHKYFFI
jgi:hypothetical protein